MEYRILKVTGDAGFEKTEEIPGTTEANNPIDALNDSITEDWPARQWLQDKERAIAVNPEHDYDSCRYSDFYYSEPKNPKIEI